tara:strand:+ start:389 stop:910 length:522 start_codon:yes stop_codon:yes gene_type:complete
MKIIDNALPESTADFLEDMTTRFDFQWSYQVDREFASFAKPLYDYHTKKSIVDEANFIRFESIVNLLGEKSSIDKESYITRVRFGMNIPMPNEELHQAPIIDQRDKHTVVMYFVNDSTGDTYFFDNKLEVIDSVTPKKNRLVVFDGGIPHACSYPQSGQRITLNLNFNSQEVH